MDSLEYELTSIQVTFFSWLSCKFCKMPNTQHTTHNTNAHMSPTVNQTNITFESGASGSSFYYAFLFLPTKQRAALTAFYAFCRAIDDVVDEVHAVDVARPKLLWWQSEVNAAFAGKPSHPIMQNLMPHCNMYPIKSHHLQSVIEGCAMDLSQNRYLDDANLQTYCHLVAGVVGEVADCIFGQTTPETTLYAHAMGQAVQYTNILRDVGEDARRGRIYLPINTLQQFDVKAHELLNFHTQHDEKNNFEHRFRTMMQHQTQKTHAMYRHALQLLPLVDFRSQKPGLMMASIYRQLLVEMEKQQFPVMTQRVKLTPLRKFWHAWKVQALGRL